MYGKLVIHVSILIYNNVKSNANNVIQLINTVSHNKHGVVRFFVSNIIYFTYLAIQRVAQTSRNLSSNVFHMIQITTVAFTVFCP